MNLDLIRDWIRLHSDPWVWSLVVGVFISLLGIAYAIGIEVGERSCRKHHDRPEIV